MLAVVMSPAWLIVKSEVPEEEATVKGFLPAAPVTAKVDPGVVLLIPTRLVLVTFTTDAPEEEATSNKFRLGSVEVPWTNKVAVLVVVPMATEPLELTLRSTEPVVEAIWKGSRVPEAWTLKLTPEDVAFIPATVPLS